MNRDEIRICLTGGSTGGHFFPLIFVAREIYKLAKKENLNVKIFYLGSKPFKEDILKEENIEVFIIPEIKLRKYLSFKNFIDLLKIPYVFILVFYHLYRLMPNLIFSKGGPTSFLVVFVGWLLNIPIFIHESDSLPGLSNKLSSYFAKKIFLAFEITKQYFPENKTLIVGQPIDIEIIKEEPLLEDFQKLNLDPNRRIILILGGSQGSKFLNDLIVKILPELLNFSQVVHIVGEKNYNEFYFYAKGILLEKNPSKIKDYHVYPFLRNETLIILMKMADLIISRAGSSTIFEIAALGKPSILIPLESNIAGYHQIINARIYDKFGAGKTLEGENIKPHILLKVIQEILNNEELKNKMKEQALKFAKNDTSLKIALEIINFIKQNYFIKNV